MAKQGFTVVEILVVLAVLAILIGMAVPRIKGMQDEGTVAQVRSELKMLQTAIESYYIHQNPQAYPSTTAAITEDILTQAIPKVVSRIMYDPFGATATTEYGYVVSANGLYYVVGSPGVARDGTTFTIDADGAVTKDADTMICLTNGSGC